ncbi:MAG: hypothetical protein FJ336_02580 [Sphingomonadales bacterium]|nr:hypothetical protein [Sphingomonadales bacterium]
MSKPFVLLSCVLLVGLGSACESNTSTPERIPNEAARGSHPVSIEQFLSEAPSGQYLVSDSRNDKPLLHLVFAMDSGKVLSAKVSGFPAGSPYKESSPCSFCPSDHPGYGKALRGLRLLEELRPGRRGWIGGQMLDPTLGYRYLADLEQGNGEDLSIVLRIGSQRRVLWLRKVQGQ